MRLSEPLGLAAWAALTAAGALVTSRALADDTPRGSCSSDGAPSSKWPGSGDGSSTSKDKKKSGAPTGDWAFGAPGPSQGCTSEPQKSGDGSSHSSYAPWRDPSGTGRGGGGRGQPDYPYPAHPYSQDSSNRAYRLEALAESSYLFSQAVRTTAGARLLAGPVELSLSASLFVVPPGSNGPSLFDAPLTTGWLGDAGAYLGTPDIFGVHAFYGGGLLYGNNGGHAATGGYGVYGIELFPTEPVVVTAVGKLGGLSDSLYVDLRATVGVMVDIFEPYVGYDYARIDGAPLGGFVLGVRVWL